VEVEKWISEVVCDKEHYELFQKILAEPLEQMFESKVVATGKDQFGRLLIKCESRESKYAKAGKVMDHEQCFVVPFCIFMTAVLAFFALILGKGLLSTSCYSCNILSAKWTFPSHERGMA